MNPLLLTVGNIDWTETGRKNLENLNLNEITIVDFDHKDVVRHPLVSKIVKAYSVKQDND